MEDRKKSGPLSPTWAGIKGKHKALSNGMFRPDIAPVLKNYDQTMPSYDKLVEQKGKLKDVITDFVKQSSALGDKVGQHQDELAKVLAKDQEQLIKNSDALRKYSGDGEADLDQVNSTLTGLANAAGDLVNMRKSITDQLTKIGEQKLALLKKTRDTFKSQSDAITNGIKKLETDADKLEGQIRQIAGTYQKTAVQMDHDEIVDDIRDLVDKL